MAEIIDEQQRLQRWIVELFSPVTEPTRRDEKSVRFGLGEFDLPGMVFSHWAVIRGLVWAFQEVAPTAWSEIKALAQEAVDGMRPQWATPEEADRLDQIFLARFAVLCKELGLSQEIPGLESDPEEILASAHQRELLVVPNLQEVLAWRARCNLADDRSLFTVALIAAAFSDTDQFRELPATNIAWGTFSTLLMSGLPNASQIPSFRPDLAGSLEAYLRLPYPQAFRFEFSRFNPFLETPAPYKDAALTAFKRELDAHMDACYTALMDREVAPVPVKRVPDSHFRWYIRYQVLGQEIGQVAEAEYATAGAVSLALDQVAELAGVPLRESKRGRRRKKNPPSASGISS